MRIFVELDIQACVVFLASVGKEHHVVCKSNQPHYKASQHVHFQRRTCSCHSSLIFWHFLGEVQTLQQPFTSLRLHQTLSALLPFDQDLQAAGRPAALLGGTWQDRTLRISRGRARGTGRSRCPGPRWTWTALKRPYPCAWDALGCLGMPWDQEFCVEKWRSKSLFFCKDVLWQCNSLNLHVQKLIQKKGETKSFLFAKAS